MVNKRLKYLFSNTLVFTIANFSTKILVFLMVPLYTTVLSTEDYGISDMVNTISNLMVPILTVSISSAVLRFCFVKEYSSQDIYTIAHRVIFIGFIAAIAVTAVLYFLNIFPQLGFYLWFTPALFFVHSYLNFLSYFSRGIGEVKISATAGVVSTFTIVALNLLFLLIFKWGIIGYMISYLAGPIMAIIVIWMKVKGWDQMQTDINRDLQKQMVRFSLPLIPNDLSWWALNSFNRFFVISVLGVSAVGIYSASAKIPAILTAVFGIFTQAWMLSAFDDYGSKESTMFICSIHKKMYSLLTVITGVFIILSKPLAVLLLKGDFASGWNMMPFLMISVFMGAMSGFYGSIYSAEKKNATQFVSTLIGCIISIVILILLLKQYGIMVAAISNMVGYIIIWFIRKVGIKKFINIGMSDLRCILLLVMLIFEGTLVSCSRWIVSLIVLLGILICNIKEIKSSFLFVMGIVHSIVNKQKNA